MSTTEIDHPLTTAPPATPRRNAMLQRCGIWCAPLCGLVFFVGVFPLAHLLPPPIKPTSSTAHIISWYHHHAIGLRWGAMCLLWGGALLMPAVAVITSQMRRIDGMPDFLPRAFTIAGVLVCVEIMLAGWAFGALGFGARGWDPGVIRAFSDLAWLMFVWPNPVTILMLVCLGVGILLARDEGIYPRWFGYANLLAASAYVPSCFVDVVKSGPLAWNGLLSFWLAAADFGAWLTLVTWLTLRAINHEPSAGATPARTSATTE